MDRDVSRLNYRNECTSKTQLGALLYSHWNKESNFLIGLNYTKNDGDLWTSLSLKLNVKKKLNERLVLTQSRVKANGMSYLQIPLWITEFLSLADFKVSSIPERGIGNELSMVYICDDDLYLSSFIKMFCICVFKNMSLYIYDEEKFKSLGWNLKLSPLRNIQQHGKLYVCNEDELLEIMENRA